jgi:hypothetical protein
MHRVSAEDARFLMEAESLSGDQTFEASTFEARLLKTLDFEARLWKLDF